MVQSIPTSEEGGMRRKPGIAVLALAMIVGLADLPGLEVLPARAQMDWLTPGLKAQRHANIRRAQQRRQQGSAAQPGVIGPNPARMQQFRRQLEPEYYRRVQRDGKAAADEWLRRTAWRIGVQEGRRARQEFDANNGPAASTPKLSSPKLSSPRSSLPKSSSSKPAPAAPPIPPPVRQGLR